MQNQFSRVRVRVKVKGLALVNVLGLELGLRSVGDALRRIVVIEDHIERRPYDDHSIISTASSDQPHARVVASAASAHARSIYASPRE